MRTWVLACAVTVSAVMSSANAEQGDWLIRARAVLVAPTEESSPVLPLSRPSLPWRKVIVLPGR